MNFEEETPLRPESSNTDQHSQRFSGLRETLKLSNLRDRYIFAPMGQFLTLVYNFLNYKSLNFEENLKVIWLNLSRTFNVFSAYSKYRVSKKFTSDLGSVLAKLVAPLSKILFFMFVETTFDYNLSQDQIYIPNSLIEGLGSDQFLWETTTTKWWFILKSKIFLFPYSHLGFKIKSKNKLKNLILKSVQNKEYGEKLFEQIYQSSFYKTIFDFSSTNPSGSTVYQFFLKGVHLNQELTPWADKNTSPSTWIRPYLPFFVTKGIHGLFATSKFVTSIILMLFQGLYLLILTSVLKTRLLLATQISNLVTKFFLFNFSNWGFLKLMESFLSNLKSFVMAKTTFLDISTITFFRFILDKAFYDDFLCQLLNNPFLGILPLLLSCYIDTLIFRPTYDHFKSSFLNLLDFKIKRVSPKNYPFYDDFDKSCFLRNFYKILWCCPSNTYNYNNLQMRLGKTLSKNADWRWGSEASYQIYDLTTAKNYSVITNYESVQTGGNFASWSWATLVGLTKFFPFNALYFYQILDAGTLFENSYMPLKEWYIRGYKPENLALGVVLYHFLLNEGSQLIIRTVYPLFFDIKIESNDTPYLGSLLLFLLLKDLLESDSVSERGHMLSYNSKVFKVLKYSSYSTFSFLLGHFLDGSPEYWALWSLASYPLRLLKARLWKEDFELVSYENPNFFGFNYVLTTRRLKEVLTQIICNLNFYDFVKSNTNFSV